MIRSRDLNAADRARAQKKFSRLIETLNVKYSVQLLSKFVITLGDEFQALLRIADPIPDIIWDIEQGFSDRGMRIGFGFGVLFTPPLEFAINVDGPALHHAREAIDRAKGKLMMGGAFDGFGNHDQILNGVARLLWFHRSGWTSQQRTTVDLLRQGMSQTEIGNKLKISKQAVSKHANSAGAMAYLEGERAFRLFMVQQIDLLIKGQRC